MGRLAQVGIALGVLGVVLTFMGLFPGVTGLDPAAGIGLVQIFIILTGFTLWSLGTDWLPVMGLSAATARRGLLSRFTT